MKLVWTLRLKGGTEVSVSLPAWGLHQRHNGGTSVWKILCDQETVDGLAGLLRGTGCEVDVWADPQSPEQKQERMDLLGVQKEGFVFRTAQCAECSFFAPNGANCGLEEWDFAFAATMLERHAKAVRDLRECPEGIPLTFRDFVVGDGG